MAKKFLTSLKIVNLPSDPISGSEGELYFNTSASVAKIYQAGSWSVLGAGGGGSSTTVSTTEPSSPEIGDSWYKNNTGEFYLYDGTYWVEVNGVIDGANTIDGLTDVIISSPADNEVLAYDDFSGKWINQTSIESGLLDTSATEQTKSGNLIIGGNLTVQGTTTTFNTEQLNIEDNIITLNSGVTGNPLLNSGIEIERGTSDNVSILWNESSDKWTLTNDGIVSNPIATQNGYTYSSQITIKSYDGITDGAINLETYLNAIRLSDDDGVTITTNSGSANFLFNNSGQLQFPDTSIQNTAFLGISSYSTTNLSEGTNLYYTDERAQDSIGNNLGVGLLYNDATGAISNSGALSLSGTANEISVSASTGNITIGITDSPIFVTPNVGVATATSINGTTIPSSKTLVVTTDIGSTVQGYDADLSSISALTGTSGLLTTNGSGTWSVDTNTYSTTSHNHTVDSLSNVVITGTPTDGQALVWDTSTSKWINETVVQDLSSYLTSASAASTYQPIGSYITSESDTLETVTDRGATSTNAISISNTTEATSATTGALVISGGVGIGEDLYVNNDIYIGGDINVTGSISGSLTYLNVTDLIVTDPLIYLADSNLNDMVDIGLFAAYNHSASIQYHSGLIRDASDSGKWKLASSLLDPVSNVINFNGATFDTLVLGNLEATNGSFSGSVSGSWSGNVIPTTKGGTGLSSIGTAGQALKVNSTADGLEWGTVSGGGGSSAAAVTSDPPSSPEINQVWQDLDTGRIYVYNGNFWIEVQQNGSLGLLRYLGASSTAPTTSIDGSSLQVGEVYFDTVFNGMKVYNGTAWVDAFTASSLNISRWVKTVVGGETSLSGNDDSSLTLVYTPGIEEVYLNGVKLIRGSDYIASSGSVISNLEPLTANSVVEVISYSGFTLANTYTKLEVDNLIQKKGVRWTEVAGAGTSITTLVGLDDYSNTLEYTPGTEQVFINGILIARGLDYNATNGTSIVLVSALTPGDVVEVVGSSAFSVANTYTKAEIDAKDASIMVFSLSDEFSNLTTGSARVTFRAPFGMTLTQIPRASLSTSSSSGLPTVDINVNGTSILGANKLSIDINEKTSVTAATATTLVTTGISDDSEITFDIDVAGTGAKGLKVVLYYKRA